MNTDGPVSTATDRGTEEWQPPEELLVKEKELTRARDALAAATAQDAADGG